MRANTALAGTTVALMALLWSAPTALAADTADNTDSSTATVAPVAPGGGHNGGGTAGGNTEGQREQPPVTTDPTPVPEPVPEPTPAPRPLPAPVPTPTPAPVPTTKALAPIPEPRASLSLSPKTVRAGDMVTANARCENSRQRSLTGDSILFSGNTGRVGQGANLGDHNVTLVCSNGTKDVGAVDTFTVQQIPNDGDLKAHLTVSPGSVRTGDTLTANASCEGGRQQSLSADGVQFNGNSGVVSQDAREGQHTAILVCGNGGQQASDTANFMVNRVPGGGGAVKATLQVSPKRVRQGEAVYANGTCVNGRQAGLFGDDVAFRGNTGWVNDNAREGDHTVTRVCVGANGARDQATDHFSVVRGDGDPGAGGPRDLWLSDRSGYQGDSVDVSVRCRDNNARLDSDALDDITLHRDGGRLTGTAHVERNAGYGWHRVTVACDGNRASTGFYVLRDRDHETYLDLDPGYGHPGDAIDVHVGCDRSVGSLDSEGDAVLDDIDLDQDGRPWRFAGTTHVRDDAERGEHTIRIRCGDQTLERAFFVQGNGDNNGGSGDDGDTPGGGDTVSVYPQGAPETGGGPVGTGSPTAVLALGLTGLTGAAGAGAASSLRGERR
jgi:hypothetical protein